MKSSAQPLLIVLAGPNGAGKSTFYEQYLAARGLPFVNADRIAVEQFGTNDPVRATEAAAIADQIRLELVAHHRSFIFETVLSDPVGAKVAFFKSAQRQQACQCEPPKSDHSVSPLSQSVIASVAKRSNPS